MSHYPAVSHAFVLREVGDAVIVGHPGEAYSRLQTTLRARFPENPIVVMNLTNGPGKLCVAMGIDRQLDKADLLADRVWLEEFRKVQPSQIAKGPRIGIDYAEEWIDKPWRFWISDNTYVSRR